MRSRRVTSCVIIRARMDSIEPTLPDGCLILFDRHQSARREREIYAVRPYSGPASRAPLGAGRPVTSPTAARGGVGAMAAGH